MELKQLIIYIPMSVLYKKKIFLFFLQSKTDRNWWGYQTIEKSYSIVINDRIYQSEDSDKTVFATVSIEPKVGSYYLAFNSAKDITVSNDSIRVNKHY
jgi:hypothetical protein